jgi:predicted alpha/beta hydrolase family esterase
LAKYFSENNLPKRAKAVLLIGAPFDDEGGNEKLASFSLKSGLLENFARQCDQIYFFNSEDDPIVPFAQLAKYQADLPDAQVMIFKDRGHFNTETFSELADLLKKISIQN